MFGGSNAVEFCGAPVSIIHEFPAESPLTSKHQSSAIMSFPNVHGQDLPPRGSFPSIQFRVLSVEFLLTS